MKRRCGLVVAAFSCGGLFLRAFCPTLAFAQGNSQSATKKMHVGAHAGLLLYGSPSLNVMNKRLGNSLALPVSSEFGRTQGYALHWRNSTRETWHWGLEGTLASETLSAEGTSTPPARVMASTAFQNLSLWGALRFAPLPRFSASSFSPFLGLVGFRPNSGGTNSIKGFYALLIAKAGFGRFSHSYELEIPQDNSAVAYSGWALNGHYGGGLRAAYRLGQWADFELETCYVGTLPLLARTEVSSFLVEGQNLLSRKGELQAHDITRSRWQMVSVTAGLSLFF